MVRMGLRAASPTATAAGADADDDDNDDGSCDGGDGGDEGPPPQTAEGTCFDRPRADRSDGRRRYHHPATAHTGRRFDSMHEIAGNLAAGVQRITFQCALPWTRSRRRRAAERSTPVAAAAQHHADGTAMSEEEQRARACEQILQLSEQQIVGTNMHTTCTCNNNSNSKTQS